MAIRRWLAASPLAVVVAVTAHVAGFGSSHALGGAVGLEIARTALASLALVALGGLFWAAARHQRYALVELADRLVAPLPGSGRFGPLALALFAGGTGIFTLLEFVEGHAGLPAVSSLLALAAAALAVAGLIRLAARAIVALGFTLAALAGAVALAGGLPSGVVAVPVRIARPNPAARLRRGRAPPHVA